MGRVATVPRQQFAEADSILREAIAERAFPGAAFGVFAHGQIQVLDGVGGFTYDAATTPVTSATVYDLASVTKVIATTSMAMLLHQTGQLSIDQPLVDLLPAFAHGNAVTLRLLLAHASGLPGYARLFEEAHTPDALLNACLRLPLTSIPGTQAEYSDPGFILLGRALEVIAGEPLQDFCAREIFTPFHMHSTCFRPPAAWRSGIPPTEDDQTFRHRIVQGEVQDENCFILGGVAGHAGLFSSALDPLRYAQGLFQQQLLTEQTLTLSPAAPACPRTARAPWDGILLRRLRRPAGFLAPTPRDISAILVRRYGSTSSARRRSSCSPTVPGPTARAKASVRCGRHSTMRS